MNKNLVNLTPHTLNILSANGGLVFKLEPSGNVARVSVFNDPMLDLDDKSMFVNGVPLFAQSVGDVVGLPEPQEGTFYVVSTLVRNAVPDRTDVFSPGDLKRDVGGQPVGCIGLVGN